MIDIEKLRELEKKATPAPWAVDTTAGKTDGISWEIEQLKSTGKDIETVSDIVFIAEMRNALPDLLAELETLRAIVQELATCDPYDSEWSDCMFCGETAGRPHEADCLIERAKKAME